MNAPNKSTDALADVGELNHVTPRADNPAPHPGPSLSPAPGALLDDHQVAWDAGLHESPPSKASDGHWKRKRGNGARVAAGKSIFVPPPTRPKAEGAAPAPAGQPAGAAPSGAPGPGAGSFLNLPNRPAPGAPPPVEALPESAYEDTAENLTSGLWGLAALIAGDAWKAGKDEYASYRAAFQRLWWLNQWPRLGPWISLAFLVVGSISKRRDDPSTKKAGAAIGGFVRSLWDKVRNRKVVQVREVKPEGEPRG